MDLVAVFPVLLSYWPYPILQRMIGHGLGNNSHNPNRHQHQSLGVASGSVCKFSFRRDF